MDNILRTVNKEKYREVYSEDLEKRIENSAANSTEMYFKEISKIPILTKEEEISLAIKAQAGDMQAKKRLIECNLRLVVSVVKRYYFNRIGVPLNDLIQEGNIGLMMATEKFNPNLGVRFSTYATWWIKSKVFHAYDNQSRTIKLPYHICQKLRNYKVVSQNLTFELGRAPSSAEIAERMHSTEEEINDLKYLEKNNTLSFEELSIDKDSYGDIIDYLTYQSMADYIDFEEEVLKCTLPSIIEKLFEDANLNDKQKDILRLRFGLVDGKKHSLASIGKIYNVTRERIRQIEIRAMQKIRGVRYLNELACFALYPSQAEKAIRYKFINYFLLKEETKEMKPLRNIYEYLSDYSKEEIDSAIESLSEYDKKIVYSRYGGNLENPVKTEIDSNLKQVFYASVIPKMKKILKKRKTVAETNNDVKENEQVINKQDYFNMAAIFQNPSFKELLNSSSLTVKEAVVIALKFGYIDGKVFQTEKIADFLQIEESEIIQISKKMLLLYKESINKKIDSLINDEFNSEYHV